MDSIGECMATPRRCQNRFVVSEERASLCCRFVQLPNMVGRLCGVCQHFLDFAKAERLRKSRIRGGMYKRSGFS
jgi:hypothetical protein